MKVGMAKSCRKQPGGKIFYTNDTFVEAGIKREHGKTPVSV